MVSQSTISWCNSGFNFQFMLISNIMFRITCLCLFILTFHPVRSQMDCVAESECAYSTQLVPSGDLECSGYKSCIFSNLTALDDVSCSGTYSCYSAIQINGTGTVICRGDGSCANAFIAAGVSVVGCYAPNSCFQTTVDSSISLQVYCNGDNSCSQSNMTAITLTANGAYSFNNGTVSSAQLGPSHVYTFTGYFAGYGGTVICLDSDVCTIDCYGNACYNLTIDCDAGATCIVNCDNNASIVCPNGYQTNFARNYTFEILYDALEELMISDQECDITGDVALINQCDDGYQCDTEHIFNTNSSICCRGSQTCDDNTVLNTTGDFIYCGAFEACSLGNLGRHVEIKHSENNTIHCNGAGACQYATVITNDTIHCDYESCFPAIIYNAKNLFCSGASSCRGASTAIHNVENVYVLGGSFAVWTATISARNSTQMNVYLLSPRGSTGTSGNLNIECLGDTWCYIECGVAGGCTGVEISCAAGGICAIYCDESIGLTCPDTLSGNYSFVDRGVSGPPTLMPTRYPTYEPTSPAPTELETAPPSNVPSGVPTKTPRLEAPTHMPTDIPTGIPTTMPIEVTVTTTTTTTSDGGNDTMGVINATDETKAPPSTTTVKTTNMKTTGNVFVFYFLVQFFFMCFVSFWTFFRLVVTSDPFFSLFVCLCY